MAQSATLLARIVASSVIVVNRAGKIIRDVMSRGELNIIEKGKNDLQTEADRSAQKCIISSLSKHFPNITIIGEDNSASCEIPSDWIVTDMDQEILTLKLPESLDNIEAKNICVWVDPLDGTSEYTQGLVEHVTVLVGVAVGKRAVAGIIHQPYYKNDNNGSLGRTIWGIDGVGIGGFKNISPPIGKRILTTSRSHSNETVEKAVNSLEPTEVLRVGGAGHKVMLLLEGKAHCYVFASKGSKRWDTCAPEAILHAVGGKLTDLLGQTYNYDSKTDFPNIGGVLATAPDEDHRWYLNHIPDEIKQKFQ
ncbi:3'(2'),5'-bisphosphate nucleotidase 1 isoform X2 [Leptopilina boulardi]|nr:3'(2'),5'-bisphosphate nucleotidase 1 isoform X2 [Leptopilina boulardi]XP_051166500.1 3'(2'),5'-bisphosphate nucleotidase 1 isoform X2 [Leptopilina boulardi]